LVKLEDWLYVFSDDVFQKAADNSYIK